MLLYSVRIINFSSLLLDYFESSQGEISEIKNKGSIISKKKLNKGGSVVLIQTFLLKVAGSLQTPAELILITMYSHFI